MSSSDRIRFWAPVLLAGATMTVAAMATPASAQRVEVFVNGQRVTDIVVSPAGNGLDGANGFVNGANGTRYGNGNGRVVNGARDGNGNGRVVNGARDGSGNGRVVNGARDGSGKGRVVNGANGTRYVNGNGRRVVNGANSGNGLQRGFHSHSHIGPYDECFRDRRTGLGHCTGRHWGRHSGPHRGLHRGAPSAALF